MAKSDKTIHILAQSLDRHLEELGMGPQQLVDLACALIDQAARRVAEHQATPPVLLKAS